jgi:NADH-quinone oxidoreductase subunit L
LKKETLVTWLEVGDLQVDFGLRLDPLSLLMLLIVTGVGGAIHIYSWGYMHEDRAFSRYFACLSLFTFSMLGIVLADNFLMMFIFWELVGVSSYLLIGHWFERPSAADACKKAFLTNRLGDFGFLLGILMVWGLSGGLNFSLIEEQLRQNPALFGSMTTLVGLLIFCGAVGKSAQFPLHVWLPDAMEGPTPVSALIHAATMVTAGVFLIVRMHFIFELAPKIEDLAAGLGAATLIVAGLVALVQTDIKRVIAYSTMSQIGYMFLGAGLGAYPNAMFHLMTHAFFKALLFMAAGLVIHALAGEQDMRKMGGLNRLLPFTYVCFAIGALSLSGIPPFAGFFSKDSILAAALDHGWYGELLWVAGMVGTFLTGLYAFRMLFIVFWGEPSGFVREHLVEHKHSGEGPLSMTSTVGVLAVLTVVGGFLQFANVWTPLTTWLDPVARPLVEASGTQEAVSSILAVALGAAGIGIAWWIYGSHKAPAPRIAWAQNLLEHKFYFDEAYDFAFYRPAVFLATGLGRWIERPLVFGSVRELVQGVGLLGRDTSRLQTGLVRTYVLLIAASIAALTVVFVAVR